MTEIWETRITGKQAVQHGSATLYTAWKQTPDRVWHMMGSYWRRGQAEAALA